MTDGIFEDRSAGARETASDPLPLTGATQRQQEYPLHALGPVLESATRAVMRHAFVPASLAAQSALSACSLAIQAHFDVRLPTGQYRPTTIYFVTIATTGERKSTSDGYFMAPAEEYQKELHDKHALENGAMIAKKAAWDIAKAEAIKANKARGAQALETAMKDIGEKPADPMEPILIARAGTTQGLLKYFEKARPSLGLMSDEGGSWLGGFGMSEDQRLNTVATLSDLWDGKPIQRLTGGEGASMLYGRRLTFHLMIQPVLAGKLMGDAEMKGQGFLSRLLVTQPESLAGQRIVDPDLMDMDGFDREMSDYRQRVSDIIRAPLPLDPETNILKPRGLRMTDDAQRMWWEFYNENERRVGPNGDLQDVQGFVGKLPEQAARIAAVLGAFEQGARLQVVDAPLLARGIELAEFYLSEALRLIGMEPVDPVTAMASTLSDWLKDKWDENLISIRMISNKGPNQFRKLGADGIRPVIETLIRNDHLSPKLSSGGPVGGKHARECWRVQVGRG
jgi:hypothetical protein